MNIFGELLCISFVVCVMQNMALYHTLDRLVEHMLGAVVPDASGNMTFRLVGSASCIMFYDVGSVVVNFRERGASVSFARNEKRENFQCSDIGGIKALVDFCSTAEVLNADCSIVKAGVGNFVTRFCILSVNTMAFHLFFDRVP